MKSGLFMTGAPARRRVAVARKARQNGKPRPVRKGFGADGAPRMELSPQGRPRFRRFAHPLAGGGDVEQDRFYTFHLRQAGEALRIHPRRGEQLGRRADEPRIVGHLPQAESDADFFVRDVRVVWRERRIEVALVMFGAPFHRGFQEPYWQMIAGPAQSRQADGQTQHMSQPAYNVRFYARYRLLVRGLRPR